MNDKIFEIMATIVNALTETLYFLEIEADAMTEEKEAEDCRNNVSVKLAGDTGDDSSVAEVDILANQMEHNLPPVTSHSKKK